MDGLFVPGICNNPLYIDPIITFTPVIAPTGIVAIREDSVYPAQYHNNLLFADFNFGQLHRIVLGGARVDRLLQSYYRLQLWTRWVACGHAWIECAGARWLYLCVEREGSIFRVVLQ